MEATGETFQTNAAKDLIVTRDMNCHAPEANQFHACQSIQFSR